MTARLVLFPLSRNIGKARRVAEVLTRREGKAQDAYWHRICQDLAAMLRKHGASEDDVHAQLNAFRDTVARILSADEPSRGGGDAA